MIDLFGNEVVQSKRALRSFFKANPFSVLDTTERDWVARKRAWRPKIKDEGATREGALFGQNARHEVTQKVQAINAGVSVLDPVLAEVLLTWFAPAAPAQVFDPFAGDTVFGFVAGWLGHKFTGIELRQEQALYNQSRCDAYGLKCRYICDDALNLEAHIQPASMDFIFSCPPYADLEKYSDDPRDLSNMPHDKFFDIYGTVLRKLYGVLKENRFAVIVISEVRDKSGEYIGLVPFTILSMQAAGFKYWNEIILVNSAGTLPFRVGRFMNTNRKIGRMHQNVLVFYKGDPSEIKVQFHQLIDKNNYYNEGENL